VLLRNEKRSPWKKYKSEKVHWGKKGGKEARKREKSGVLSREVCEGSLVSEESGYGGADLKA